MTETTASRHDECTVSLVQGRIGRHTATLALTGVLLTAGCGPVGNAVSDVFDRPDTIHAGAQLTHAFLTSIDESGVRRWTTEEVTYAWFGEPTERDQEILWDTARWLESTGVTPSLRELPPGSDADIDIHVLDSDAFDAAIAATTPDPAHVAGVTNAVWGADGAMLSAEITLDVSADQASRNRTIVHEMLHAMGIGHHDCPGGLVFGQTDYDPTWTPGPFDAGLVQLTYDPRIATGQSAKEVARQIDTSSVSDNPPCPTPEFETVAASDGRLLWCPTDSEPGEIVTCQAPDPDGDGPSGDADTIGWIKDGTLFDYNPETHMGFMFSGHRLICEHPTPTTRGRCVPRDSDEVEGRRVWWTDGALLYDTTE